MSTTPILFSPAAVRRVLAGAPSVATLVPDPADEGVPSEAFTELEPADYGLDVIAFVVRALPHGLAALFTVADDATLTREQVKALFHQWL